MRIRRLLTGEIVRDDGDALAALPVASVAELLRLRRDDLRTLLASDLPALSVPADAPGAPPVDGRTEIWASGVTYLRSRTARMGEATDPDIYDRVYAAQRPELFFKSAAWRAVTDGDDIGIRDDSTWNVPEPELAVVANAYGEIVGYAVCDDVSSRSIEGENPLYLPQAKVYAGACAVSPGIRPAWEVDAAGLGIRLRIARDGAEVFAGETGTDQLARSLDELVSYLFRAETFPDGAWLSTGTGIVPPDAFTLEDGDVVEIEIDEVGTLRNTVRRGRDHWTSRSLA
jgi:2-dehydro-3-deoxy-D-arabinonate dehydratase